MEWCRLVSPTFVPVIEKSRKDLPRELLENLLLLWTYLRTSGAQRIFSVFDRKRRQMIEYFRKNEPIFRRQFIRLVRNILA